jgi:sulfate transport system ATP-binding protein
MEIADGLVLMRDGRIEQTGSPLALYHDPVSPFVMNFLGPANALAVGGAIRYVRPHEVRVSTKTFEGSQPARVTRIVELGSRKRLELSVAGDVTVSAEVTAPFNGLSAVGHGDIVHFAPVFERSFTNTTRERSA